MLLQNYEKKFRRIEVLNKRTITFFFLNIIITTKLNAVFFLIFDNVYFCSKSRAAGNCTVHTGANRNVTGNVATKLA